VTSSLGNAPGGRRLFALVVGIDHYTSKDVPPLQGAVRDAMAVNDAHYRTHQPSSADEYMLLVSGAEPPPTRQVILAQLHRVAAVAGPGDQIMIYLAGHGITTGGRAAFVPVDGTPRDAASLLWIDELQHALDQCACQQRVLLLDTCQEWCDVRTTGATAGHQLGPEAPPGDVSASPRGLEPFRQPETLGTEFLAALQAQIGWSILTSCGPGQRSWESAELQGHGVFSHHVALGLRGDADLDNDQTVGLDELVQYLAKAVPREAKLAQRERTRLLGWTEEQVPYLICRGPVTAFTDEGAVSSDARPADWRRFTPPPGLFAAWIHTLRTVRPYGEMNNWSWHTPGAGAIYGLVMGVQVLLVGGTPAIGAVWLGLGVAMFSALLWHAAISLSAAAAQLRYHHGGYLSPAGILAWHGLLFAVVGPMARDATHCIHFGLAVFTILAVLITLGFNTLHIAISLFELERRGEEALMRDLFRQLERKWLRSDTPNPIPCEIFHPKVYLALWPVLSVALLAHVVAMAWRERLSTEDGLVLLYDLGLWVLTTWFISGYNALYQWHFRRHPKQVRT
jgi:hypothetical protein